MKCAIVHFKPCFTKWNRLFFTRNLKEKIKSELSIMGKNIPIYCIPIIEEKPSKKMVSRFITYLKEEKIDTILLSDSAERLAATKELKKNFSLFEGTKVINYKLYDILRKCAEAKNTDLSKSTLIFFVNEPEIAKHYILKVYKFVKRIKIKTNKPSLFYDLSSFFLYEYGLFIEIIKEVKKTDHDILISLNENNEEEDLFISSEKSIEVIFSSKEFFKEIITYKHLNQEAVEFLIYLLYGNLKDENIKRFFKSYPVRVIKLIK